MNLFGISCLTQINTTKAIINSCLYGLGGMLTSRPIIAATMICKAILILSLFKILSDTRIHERSRFLTPR